MEADELSVVKEKLMFMAKVDFMLSFSLLKFTVSQVLIPEVQSVREGGEILDEGAVVR